MSRQQSSTAFGTASSQNATNNTNAQNAAGAAQNDIGNYSKQLASYVSGDPYTAGGQYDQTINAGLANTSDAGANSLAGALQSQSLKTGQNSAANAATAASNAQANTRNLSSSLASAQQQRISDEAGYQQNALSASAVPAQMESSLYGTAAGAAQGNLSSETSAAQTPSFWDTLGDSIAGIPSAAAGGAAGAATKALLGGGKCWIASELYGGWYEPRTVLVRNWLHTKFSEHHTGRFVVALYGRFGERTARLIHKYPVLRLAFLPIFNAALARATRWDQIASTSPSTPSAQALMRLKGYQERERLLREEVDARIQGAIVAYLGQHGFRSDPSLVAKIALDLVTAFNGNALLTGLMDDLRCLPATASRSGRLATIDRMIRQYLPGVAAAGCEAVA